MTLFRTLSFKALSHRNRRLRGLAGAPSADGQVRSADEAQLPPVAGYERLDGREVTAELFTHSQVELAAIERFERSHRDRTAVLNKLRYLRGPEPLPHYDALSREAIGAAIGDADVATLKQVRAYERKFQNRAHVLEPVAGALQEHRLAATHPHPALERTLP